MLVMPSSPFPRWLAISWALLLILALMGVSSNAKAVFHELKVEVKGGNDERNVGTVAQASSASSSLTPPRVLLTLASNGDHEAGTPIKPSQVKKVVLVEEGGSQEHVCHPPQLVKLNIVFDAIIALAYFSIPIEVAYFYHRHPTPQLFWVYALFFSFIMLCGITHAIHALSPFELPTLHATFKVLCGLVSIITAVYLVKFIPAALKLPNYAAYLEYEIQERQISETTLRNKNEESKKLRSCTEKIRQTLQMQAILHETTSSLATHLDLDSCFFVRFRPDTKSLALVAPISTSNSFPSDSDSLSSFEDGSTGTLLSSTSSKPLLSFEEGDKLNCEIPFSLKAHNPNAISAFHQIARGDHIRLLDSSLLEDLFGRDATSGYADRDGKLEKHRLDKGSSVATLQLSKSSVCAHIALPENNEIALLILVRPPDGAVWSLSEIEMVRDVANQTEIALSQARSIERDKDLLSELQAKNSELAQAQRRAESATQAKSKFIAIMSHEMRTPLYVVTALTELLMDTQLSAEQRESLTTIQTSSRLLLAIISDVLDYSKFQQDNFIMDKAPFNIRTCIEKCVDIASVKAKEVNLEVYYHLKDSLPEVIDTDESRLSQVFLNLLSNAVKFTTTGSLLVQGWLDRYLTNEEIAQLYKTQFGRADQRHFASKSSSSSENHTQLQKSFSSTSADTKPVPLHDQRNPLSSSMNLPNMGPLSSSASFISSSSTPSMPNAPVTASPAQMARRPTKKLSSSSLSSNASSSSTASSSSSDFIQKPILPVSAVPNHSHHTSLMREMTGTASLNASPSLTSTSSNYSSSSLGTTNLMMPPQGTKMAILHFVVSDTGVGIPNDQIHRLFEEFTQLDTSVSRKYDGTGLGLAICRKVVTLMGGSIWVDSTPGVGSHFHFTIIVKIPPPSLAQPLMNPTPGAKGMNCLAITPILSLQLQLQDFCRQMGVNLTFAKTVQEGLEILQKSATSSTGSSQTFTAQTTPAHPPNHHHHASNATLPTQGLSSNASGFHVVLLASSSLSPDHSPFESFQKFNSIAPTLLIGDTSGLGDTMAEEIEMHQILPLPLKYKNFYISIRLCTGSPPDSEVSYERLIADMLNSSKQRQQQAIFAQSQLSHDPMSAIPIISQMVPIDGSLGVLEHVGSTGSFSNASSLLHQLHRQSSSSSLLSSSSNTSSPLVVPGNVIGQVGQNLLIPLSSVQPPSPNAQGSDGKVIGNIVSGVPIPVLCYQGPWIANTTSSGNSSPHSTGIAFDVDPLSRAEALATPSQGTAPLNAKPPLILNPLPPPLGIAKSTSGNSLSSSSSNDSSIPSPRRYDPSTLSQLTGQSTSILSSLIMHHAPSASMTASAIPTSSSPLRSVPSTASGGSTPRTHTASPSVHSSASNPSHHSPNSSSMNHSHSSAFTGSDELGEGNSTGSSSSRGITRVSSEDVIVDLAESSASTQFASSSATGSMKRVNIVSAPTTSSSPYEPLPPSKIEPAHAGDGEGASLKTRWESGEQINILLVEDNTVCRKVCLKQLEKLGFEKVDCAVNGQDALDQVKLKKYDLVMMDVMMPGVDGLSATRAIRQMGKEEEAKGDERSSKSGAKSNTPSSHQPYIIAITASSMLEEGSREACFGAGMDEVINKPIHLQALREAIQRFLSKSTSK